MPYKWVGYGLIAAAIIKEGITFTENNCVNNIDQYEVSIEIFSY